jgi:hypothetical protein
MGGDCFLWGSLLPPHRKKERYSGHCHTIECGIAAYFVSGRVKS